MMLDKLNFQHMSAQGLHRPEQRSGRFAICLLMVASFVLLSSATTGLCDPSDDEANIALLESPVFSPEEAKQVILHANLINNGAKTVIQYSLYNPRRDKSIDGIVVAVESDNTSRATGQAINLLIDAHCGPLQCVSGYRECSVFAGASFESSSVTLKEIHTLTPQTEEAAMSAKLLKTLPIVINLSITGSVEINNQTYALTELPPKLKSLISSSDSAALVIRFDKATPRPIINQVWNLCVDAGSQYVVFANSMR